MINNHYEGYEELSGNQKWFIKIATQNNLKVIKYSGRYMCGLTCPAVIVGPWHKVEFQCTTQQERMGNDFVVYAAE